MTNKVIPLGSIPVDRSGVITAGGTAQVLMAANSERTGFFVQNNSSGDLWINDITTAAATQPSIRLAPGATASSSMSWNPVGAISIFGATTNQAFTAREN